MVDVGCRMVARSCRGGTVWPRHFSGLARLRFCEAFLVSLGMCLVDGSLAKKVAKALIPIDVYFFWESKLTKTYTLGRKMKMQLRAKIIQVD